jgi:uncharacterized protein (TIGR00369 family)
MSDAAALLAAGWKTRPAGGFMDRLGPLWARREADGWAYALLAGDEHLNPVGVVHGGALVSLIDHALSLLAWEAADRQACVTLQLDTQFVAPARAGALVEARGEVTHRSAGMVFLRGRLTVAGQPVVAAQAIVKILRG